jgi:hypothetical protein
MDKLYPFGKISMTRFSISGFWGCGSQSGSAPFVSIQIDIEPNTAET